MFSFSSAIIEHTNKVIYLEDDDVAVVVEGKLYVHRVKRTAGEDPVRVIQTLQMELQQIMKGTTTCHYTETQFNVFRNTNTLSKSSGNFKAFMQKEIFEQPESVVNTMRGRICFDSNTGTKHHILVIIHKL